MAAASSSLGTQFHEELSCSICLELFTRPKVLPCQHTFCQDCLRDHAGRGGTFQCPNCRLQVRLPPQGVAGLPDNHLIASLCERLENQATLSEETRQQPQSGNRCSFHPTEVYRMYCKQCQMPVCEECIEGVHNDHLMTTIKKAAQENRSTVQALIHEGRNILESYCGFVRGLRETEKNLNEQKDQRDNAIIQAYNQTVQTTTQKLTERKDILLSESQQNHSQDFDRIKTERDRVLADINELSAVCDRAEQELQQRGVEFLITQQSALTGTVGKYRGKAAPTPVQTQPAVFQPADNPVPVLGQLTVPSPQKAPIPKTRAARGRVSDEGEIFVADSLNYKIRVFNQQGNILRQFLLCEYGGQKLCQSGVALDGEGNLWVVGRTLTNDGFAMQYDKQGRVLRNFDLQKTELYGGVAVDTRRNRILITAIKRINPSHYYNSQQLQGEVLVFRPDGTLVRTVGQQQGMKTPGYITVDGEGNILVSDWNNNCVYVYNEDGQFLFQFGGEGSGEGQLKKPCGICTDRTGNIIVADRGNGCVEMFDKRGKFLKHIATDMKDLYAVAMATQGQLIVTDSDNSGSISTVTIFQNI
ncbi:hypothetical protein Bbelb_120740 [Branchiostoma belcheri]|nr:hypothetical protein Bbelb_120740 [Branchiostoma belcheri]